MPGTDTSGSTARTGRAGRAVLGETLMARLTQWSVNHTMSETAWGDSDSEGFTSRKEAREDCTGSLTGKFDTTQKIHSFGVASTDIGGIPGIVTKLVLWEAMDVASYWVFPCVLLQNFQMTVDMDTKEVIEWTIDYGADGRFYRPGATNIPVESVPA